MFFHRMMDRRYVSQNAAEGGGATGGAPSGALPVPTLPAPPVSTLPPAPVTAPPAPVQVQAPVDRVDWKQKAIEAEARAKAMETQQQGTQSEFAQFRQQWEQDRAQAQAAVRQNQLIAYRAQVLGSMPTLPQEFHPLVWGQDETQLHSNAQVAWNSYQSAAQAAEQRVRQSMAPQGQPGIPPGFAPQGPQSPHMPQQGGFPSPAPYQAPAANAPEVPIQQFTSEQAIRSGRYGEMREQLLNGLAQQTQGGFRGPEAFAGYAPQQQTPQGMPYTQFPNGVQQPNPGPMPQAYGNPQTAQFGQWQQPNQYQGQQLPNTGFLPPPQQQGPALPPAPQYNQHGGEMAQAQAAAERTRMGQNPVMNQTPQGPQAYGQFAKDNAQMGAHTGQTPQGSYQVRFNSQN